MSGGQNYLLLAMDVAKVRDPLSVCEGVYFHRCYFNLCKNRVSAVSVSGWSPIGCEGFLTQHLNIPSPLPSTLVFR